MSKKRGVGGVRGAMPLEFMVESIEEYTAKGAAASRALFHFK